MLLSMKEYQKAIDTFDSGIKLDPENKELNDGLQKAVMALQSTQSNLSDEERLQQAMKDPEIQEILSDPAMRLILEQMQQNPNALSE